MKCAQDSNNSQTCGVIAVNVCSCYFYPTFESCDTLNNANLNSLTKEWI